MTNTQRKYEIRVVPRFFDPVWRGDKTFELCFNYRNYQVGDLLRFREWAMHGGYTGREIIARVTYVLYERFYLGLEKDWVALSFEVSTRKGADDNPQR